MLKRLRPFLALGLVAATAAVVSQTASSTTRATLPPIINIATVMEMTGPVGPYGQEAVDGMKLAVADVNRSKLLGKSKLKLEVLDSATNPSTAIAQVSSVVNDGKIAAVFGPLTSQEALAAAPIAQKAKLPFLAIEANTPLLIPIGNYVWRATADQVSIQNLTADVVASKDTGSKTVKILYDSGNPAMEAFDKTLEAKFKKLGYTVLSPIALPISGGGQVPNWPAEAAALESGNPSAIGLLVVGGNNDAGINALRNSGYKGLLFGQTGASGGTLIPAGANANGFVYAVSFTARLRTRGAKPFIVAFKKEHPDLTPYAGTADGWSAVHQLADAIALSGDASRAGVEKGLLLLQRQKGGFIGASGVMHIVKRNTIAPGVAVSWDASLKGELVEKIGNPNVNFQP